MEPAAASTAKVRELNSLRAKVTAKLEQCEAEIAEAEFQYLEETDHGNIVKGFEGFLHFRFSSQNRKARVRSKDRLFTRSSLSSGVPEEEESPFTSAQPPVEELLGVLVHGRKSSARVASKVESVSPAAPVLKRRRNTVSPPTPMTPSTVKTDDASTTRVTRRRRG